MAEFVSQMVDLAYHTQISTRLVDAGVITANMLIRSIDFWKIEVDQRTCLSIALNVNATAMLLDGRCDHFQTDAQTAGTIR